MPNNDSHQHVVKTSAQWAERAVEFWVIPRGCLCVELTPDKKTKLKVGEGNKYYAQLPYVNDIGDLSEYYTKEEIDRLFDNLNRMAIMSTDEYDSKIDLPLTDNKLGDVRFVKSASPSIKTDPDVYLWNGRKWIFVGYDLVEIDLSQYIKRDEFEPVAEKVNEMYPKMHTHANKAKLDAIEEPYTTAEKEKLAGLENYDDTELRGLIRQATHVHPNKSTLDQIEKPFKTADKEKLDSLENYDDTDLRNRVTAVESVAHTHSNKAELDSIYSGFVDEHEVLVEFKTVAENEIDSLQDDVADLKTKIHTHSNKNILDSTTAPYTREDKQTLTDLANITVFDGASATYDGFRGYVPAPHAGEQTYFLRGDGTWAKVKGGSGDKYKAGDGIFILSGEVTADTFPFEIYSRSSSVKQYIIYGNVGGVGELVNGEYHIPIRVSAPGYADRISTIILSEPMYAGDYIDFEKQVFAHYRTDITSQIQNPNSDSIQTGISSTGNLYYKSSYQGWGGSPRITDYFEINPSSSYEISPIYPDNDFSDSLNINVYDANKVRTRTIVTSTTNPTAFSPVEGEVYIRQSYTAVDRGYCHIYELRAVESPCVLQEVLLYPNAINTVNIDTTNKPAEVYFEVEEPEEIDPDDPMSEYSGIIYNDGVLDITQEDPNALNELTVHFRESDKVITVPAGGSTYTAGDGIDIDANDEISAKLGLGLQFDANGAIEATPYTLPIASDDTLGGIKVGDNLTIDQNGVLSASLDEYQAGEGINITRTTRPIDINYIRLDINNSRDNGRGGIIQFKNIRVLDTNNSSLQFSHASSIYGNGSAVEYGQNTRDESPQAMIEGRNKTCCTNFSLSKAPLKITFTLTTEISIANITSFSILTGADSTERDPVSWDIYASNDGVTWYKIQEAHSPDVTTARSTWITDIPFVIPPDAVEVLPGAKTINAKIGNGLSFDQNDAITVDEMTGASALADGVGGAVPAPHIGDETKFLRGDGTWIDVPGGGNGYTAGDGINITSDVTPVIEAKLGEGLHFDTNDAIAADKYLAGQGIEIGYHEGIVVTNPEYYFDTQVTCALSGSFYREFTKTTDEPALGALINCRNSGQSDSWTGPIFVGPTASSVKCSYNTDNVVGPFTYKGRTWFSTGTNYWVDGSLTDLNHHLPRIPGQEQNVAPDDINDFTVAKMIIDAAGFVESNNQDISAKLGNGLSFDSNDAIQADQMTGADGTNAGTAGIVPAPTATDNTKFLRGDGSWAAIETSTKYTEGDAIEFGHPGMTDLGFNFDTFVSKFTQPNNGTVSVDSVNKTFTLTATGSDAYTNPWAGGDLYTIPVVGGRKYRLTWDSNAPTVGGIVYAFENANTSHMHGVNQVNQNYLEFTADTTSNVNFRFGVSNSGDTITYSNIKFYEVDNADPDTNIINVKYSNGLSLDNNNALQVDQMVGATSQATGESGTVPQPLIADKDKFLKGDGTWSDPPTYTLPVATTSTLGGVKVGAGLSMNANDELGVTSPYVTSVTNQGSTAGVITVTKSDGISSDVDILGNIRLILNCNFDSSVTRNVLGEPVNAPGSGTQMNASIMGDLTVLEV